MGCLKYKNPVFQSNVELLGNVQNISHRQVVRQAVLETGRALKNVIKKNVLNHLIDAQNFSNLNVFCTEHLEIDSK